MDTDIDSNFKHAGITQAIIRAAYDVNGELGHGFLEKVYENALRIRLKEMGHVALQQWPLPV